jgi:3-hydroxyisobutyrate dehydrogenase
MSAVAVIGIGRMGWHIAAHLVAAGHDVVVCDAAPGVAERWASEHAGTWAADAAAAVVGREVVVSSLPADPQLLAVAADIVPLLGDGTVWVDHSTTSAAAPTRSRAMPTEAAQVNTSGSTSLPVSTAMSRSIRPVRVTSAIGGTSPWPRA